MNKNFPSDLKQKFTAFYNETLEQMAENHATNYSELLTEWQELHTAYLAATAENLQQWADKYDVQNLEEANFPDKIEANSVVVEIIDHNTGKIFRRSLPIDYVETDNGIRLSGETIDGKSAQIAFFSDTAITKINDLLGMGPNTPRCNHDE